MESYVKEQFTKAIAICGDKPEYENVKDFMQDMIDENVPMIAKDTPSHLLRFLHNAAYNTHFSEEFRDCIQNVICAREIDDQATKFLVRKLRIICDTREADIKKKDEQIRELEELVGELELRVEKMREINDKLTEQNDKLQKQAKGEYGPGDQADDSMKRKKEEYNKALIDYHNRAKKIKSEIMNHLSDVVETSTTKILRHLCEKKLYDFDGDSILLVLLDEMFKDRDIKKVADNTWKTIRRGYGGEEISEYEYQRWQNTTM
jgi:predicted RNase H-like nuclease (RuvC/YqgF family)